jgi:hypothetical protein
LLIADKNLVVAMVHPVCSVHVFTQCETQI